MNTYKNPWHNPKIPNTNRYTNSKEAYTCDPDKEVYRGYEIHKLWVRHAGVTQYNIVKDGVCVGMMAGPNGAHQRIDKFVEETSGEDPHV